MKLSDRKKLTKFLGECWHDTEARYETHTTGGTWAYDSIEHHYAPRCSKCGKKNPKNRTFKTWEDFGVLIERLEEKELWDDLFLFRYIPYHKIQLPNLILEAIKERVV